MSNFRDLIFFLPVAATLLISVGCLAKSDTAGLNTKSQIPVCPQKIPSEWLAPSSHPRFFCNPEELNKARETVNNTAWGRKYLEEQRSICSRFLTMDEASLRSLVPKPKSLFIYGLGMNLDPVYQKKMLWCGWDNPFCVKDINGKIYPNSDWPDDGTGAADPRTGQQYYFVAQANGFIIHQLENSILPALADLYALDGNKDAARTAAILLDSIASVYPTNRRGPMDYPTVPRDYDRGGRLDRPYYQVARGLFNYANTIDLVASSGEFERPSVAGGGVTIREHIIRNLLWDGSAFCLDHTLEGYELHNGHADYLRGAAMAGILLGQRDFCEPMFRGTLSFPAMMDNDIDRNGLYYETSPLYGEHTCNLFFTMAEMMEASRYIGWKDVPSAYANFAMRLFLTEMFDRQEVGGHIPVLGDDGPDGSVRDPIIRMSSSDPYLRGQITGAWIRLVRSADPQDRESAAQLLADTYAGKTPIEPPQDRWSIYHINAGDVKHVEQKKPDLSHFETNSVFYGGKGFAILRGGLGSKRYGAQLFFGPLNRHAQDEALTWSFYDRGAEWSYDPGYYNTHYRYGWTTQTVSHQAVTVGAASLDTSCGSGYLTSWVSTPEVQWAEGCHPDAYREHGVTLYDRLIAQVQNPADGELGYWLDISRVAGGKIHDDSFHTQMQDAKLSISLPDPSAGSLLGPIDYGRMIQDDYRLKAFPEKDFGWSPDGSGYGFLGSPQKVMMPSCVRVTLTNPGFAKKISPVIVADLLGTPQREMIVAAGPQALNAPSVPYIIRRDTNTDVSLFAKIIRLVDNSASDPITSFTTIPVKGDSKSGAWCVTWADHRRDLWILGDGKQHIQTVCKDLPEINTDARVTLIRFDANGRISEIKATEATDVSVNGGPNIKSERALYGTIKKIDPDESPVTLQIEYENEKPFGVIPSGSLLVATPTVGEPSVWTVDTVSNSSIKLQDIKGALSKADVEPISGKPGWYNLLTAVGWFYSPVGVAKRSYAIGKAIYADGHYVGRISDIAGDARSIQIKSDGRPVEIGHRFTASILEAGPGDHFQIPMTLSWKRK